MEIVSNGGCTENDLRPSSPKIRSVEAGHNSVQTTRTENCSPGSSCKGTQTRDIKKCAERRAFNGSQSTKGTELATLGCCSTLKMKEASVEGVYCGGLETFPSKPNAGTDCCQPPLNQEPSVISASPRPGRPDLEKGSTGLEHVTLGVQGLTCTACESKLKKALDSIASVRSPQTSLLLSQAEFDLDTSIGTVSEAIRSIQRTTGFTCQEISTEGQNLDILVNGDAEEFINNNNNLPYGVSGMQRLAKNVVQITYDAKLVGARELVQNAFDVPVRLAPLQPAQDLLSGKRHVRKTAYITLISILLTIPVLVLAWAPLPPNPILYGTVSLALATIVQFGIAGPFYSGALRSLIFAHVMELDLLIVLSTSTAYIFSVILYAYQVERRALPIEYFFETSTLIVTLIMVGRLVSSFARQKAIESISIRSLQPDTALLTDRDGLITTEIDARLLHYGDVFKVMPDSCVVTDGTVISGLSEVDESMVTGEAVPVQKSPGSSVIAGSINGSGALLVRLSNLPGHNTISEIATLVDEAKFSKPRLQDLADRVAGYFVPVVLALTVITFVVWIAVGKFIRHQASAVVPAVTYAISVLIVSCPCAIGLAVPMVVVIAGGVAAKRGVIFKSGETLDIARQVSHVVFDKTGTLTQGKLSVVDEQYLSEPDSHEEIAAIALGLAINSRHPVSVTIAAHLKARGIEPASVQNVTSITGCGVQGTYRGSTVRAGNPQWLSAETSPEVQSLLSKGLTVFCLSRDSSNLLAVFGLTDDLRPDALSTVSELHRRGVTVSLVSGDNSGAVALIAAKLGIPSQYVRSRCSPADKEDYIKTSQISQIVKRSKASPSTARTVVLFCGDGTNDAIALTEADIGLHIPSGASEGSPEGSDIAQSAADAVLVRPYLAGVLVLIDLSHVAHRRIVFNFAWAGLYNVVAILLAAGAFVHARVPPQFAGLGELVSVLPVIAVAAQLRWAKVG
jgi:heavy metal translocating P-type ATPase